MTPYSILVRIKVVRNDVINNFELHNQLSKYGLTNMVSLFNQQKHYHLMFAERKIALN